MVKNSYGYKIHGTNNIRYSVIVQMYMIYDMKLFAKIKCKGYEYVLHHISYSYLIQQQVGRDFKKKITLFFPHCIILHTLDKNEGSGPKFSNAAQVQHIHNFSAYTNTTHKKCMEIQNQLSLLRTKYISKMIQQVYFVQANDFE